jgi:hypothetical protein
VNFPCDGRLTVTLTAPAGVTQRVSLFDASGDLLGRAVSADGVSGAISVTEPGGCFGNDAQALTVRVESVGAERSAEPYLLTRRGDF